MEFKKHYLTHEEYQELGGTLDETPFNILELEAQKRIDKYTFGRLKDLDEQINEVKVCAFRLINYLASYNEISSNERGSISSESIDGYSVSYSSLSESVLKANVEQIKTIVKDTLAECKLDDGTPYLYCGVK